MSHALHVTSGDAVVYLFRKAGITGTHLAWRDALYTGPVPAGLSLAETSRVRAAYLGSAGFGNAIKLGRDFERRDATLARADEYDEVVLWFEHDLFDQLHVLQLLDHFAGRPADGSVQLVQSDDYLGMLAPEQLAPLHQKRRPVNGPTFALASQLWNAFREPAPLALFDLHARVSSELRHMHAAIGRLFEEYPAPRSGLSRTQRQIVQAVEDGARRTPDTFRVAQLQEEAPFLGESAFAAVLADLCAQPHALLEAGGDVLAVTPLGKDVLAGRTDWLEHRDADRWIGGVHLAGKTPWRWDGPSRAFVSPRPE